ncbi:L,D-transpeptidase [Methylovirgula sp. 4M-Z18]|uniref:L,D-transpeptidase n=1 Tax=Methylovirgula sp. 4M-Z18 TaxID=2293567 RepID=UPI0026D84A23
MLLIGLGSGLASCAAEKVDPEPALTASRQLETETPAPAQSPAAPPVEGRPTDPIKQPAQPLSADGGYDYAAMYGQMTSGNFIVPAVNIKRIGAAYLRREVDYPTDEPSGTVIVDPKAHYLYYVLGKGRAIRYGVSVGKEGFGWSGTAEVHFKREWPDWYPPEEMIERRPDLKPELAELQSGMGMKGGPDNPITGRAMYLWQNGKDTLYRIHGTNEPYSIGHNASSGCIRMIVQDVIDLYQRVPVDGRVVVLGPAKKITDGETEVE